MASPGEIEYVIGLLEEKKKHYAELGPCTDRPEYYLKRIRALDAVIAKLRRPRFDVGPFE